MGWFSQVTDFLSSPAFRIGAGVAGLASGAGAFGDMGGWGTALQGLSGAANVAAGAASTFGPNRSALDRATGALQLGLGGYNIGQSAGAVGTFGDVWNQISGDSGTTREGGLLPFAGTENMPTGTSFTPPAAPDAFQAPGTTRPGYVPPSARGEMSDAFSGAVPGQSYAQATPADVPGGGGWIPDAAAPAPSAVPPGQQPVQLPPRPPPLPGNPDVPPPGPGAATTLPTATPPSPATPGRPFVEPLPAVAAPTPLPPRGDPAATRTWLGRTWDNLARQASESPVAAGLAAAQVGSMLVGLFQQSSADIAREAQASMDPNSPNGAEFRRLYEERARREIEDQVQTVRSGLEAKFASRGMLRSTVYTNAVASMEEARIKLLADLPYNSLKAWNETAQGSGNWMRGAAALTQATAPRQDFSNMTRVLGQSPFAQQLAAGSRTTPSTQVPASRVTTPLDELYA